MCGIVGRNELSGGGCKKFLKPTDWVDMVDKFQKGVLEARLYIIMFCGIDDAHGNDNVYEVTLMFGYIVKKNQITIISKCLDHTISTSMGDTII